MDQVKLPSRNFSTSSFLEYLDTYINMQNTYLWLQAIVSSRDCCWGAVSFSRLHFLLFRIDRFLCGYINFCNFYLLLRINTDLIDWWLIDVLKCFLNCYSNLINRYQDELNQIAPFEQSPNPTPRVVWYEPSIVIWSFIKWKITSVSPMIKSHGENEIEYTVWIAITFSATTTIMTKKSG